MNRRTTLLLTFLSFLVAATVDDATAQGPGRMAGQAPRSPGRALIAIPSVDAMAEAVKADPAQRAALAEARLAWVQAMQSVRGGATPRGRWATADGPRVPPLMVFLTEATAALDVDETLALVELLEQEQGERAEARGGGRGPAGGRGTPGMHGGRGPGQPGMHRAGHGFAFDGAGPLVDELDLTEEQRTQLQALHASTMGALHALRRQAGREGEPTEAQRDEAERLRADHQGRLQAILTPQQQEQLARLREERHSERAAAAQQRFEANRAAHLEHLTKLLDLSKQQQEKVAAALDAAHATAQERLRARAQAEGPLPDLFEPFPARGPQAMDTAQEAIREILQPKQRELFARLQTLGAMSMGRAGLAGPGMHPRGPRGEGQRPGN